MAKVAAPAVFDTSVFVGKENRSLVGLEGWAPIVSVVTIAELMLGVSLARTEDVRLQRAATLTDALTARVVPIDIALVAAAWCKLRVALRKRIPANDSWVAATALALGVPLVTRDDDFDAASDIIEVVRI